MLLAFCCDERRRAAVGAHPTLNGIDFLEVEDGPTIAPALRQRVLLVHFVKPLASGTLQAQNISVEGGERVQNIVVQTAEIGTGDQAAILTVTVDRPGDFSPYVLRLVRDADNAAPPDNIDPVLSSIGFSFKAGCDTDLDCAPTSLCPPTTLPTPEIDYLAKDYATFRQLMLDRMATVMPAWQESHAADMGIAVVELLAYVGDYLSYQQDAIGTEAYLGTARRRTSIRRHARLVDYKMHDGLNARVWVQVLVNQDLIGSAPNSPALAQGTPLLTLTVGSAPVLQPGSGRYTDALNKQPEVFETMRPVFGLFMAHNRISFYNWGDRECCLPQGATRATLQDSLTCLQPGDVLIFEEVRGPRTGVPADADPAHRCAVRLTAVQAEATPGVPLTDPLTDQAITNITWHPDDALPFALCLSALNGTDFYEDVSVARGNIVLADHGKTIVDESLGAVPASSLSLPPAATGDGCTAAVAVPIPARFQPRLQSGPLVQAAPYPYSATLPIDVSDPAASATDALLTSPADGLPAIQLKTDPNATDYLWQPVRDLLNSGPESTEFVVEVEDDGIGQLRFGDNQHGESPSVGTAFYARYRAGEGVRGNVGAEAIAHIVSGDSAIIGVRNPLPARGGVDPESIDAVRQYAPVAFRTQERAVTPDDYATVAQRHPAVLRAAATLRWTGSWYTVFVTVQRRGGLPVDAAFDATIRAFLERYRMAGQDVEVDAPVFVSLEIDMQVCVKPDYLAAHVKAALLQLFSDRTLPDGRKGLFYPDSMAFGQRLFLSPLIAAAQAVPGVSSVQVTTFQRQGVPDGGAALLRGHIALGRLELARLENDPNYAEHGVFRLQMIGGR